MSVTKLTILAQTTTDYNDALFEALARDLDLEVFVIWPTGRDRTRERSSDLPYRLKCLSSPRRVDWRVLRRAVGRGYLISNSSKQPTAVILAVLNPLLPLRVAFWTDTPIRGGRTTSPLRRRGRDALLRLMHRTTDCVFGMGPFTKEILVETGLAPERYVDLPCAIPLDDYHPCEPWDGVRRPTFLAAGRLVDDLKGFSTCIGAFALVVSALGPDTAPQLAIAGTGPDEDTLRQLVIELGLTDHVTFLGWLEPDEMKRRLAKSTFFVHSASFEPYGVVILEAMASGLVVLASDRTAAAVERVDHEINGLLHEPGDIDGLASQMLKLLKEAERVNLMRTEALATAAQWPLSRSVDIVRDVVLGNAG